MANQEGTSIDQMVAPSTDAALETKYVLDTMDQDPEMRPMADLCRKAGMAGVLKGPDLLTIFVPAGPTASSIQSDDAEELRAVLHGYLLGRAVTEVELRSVNSVESLERNPINVQRDGSKTRVGGALIIRPDIECINGIIHVIDGLLQS